MGVEPTTMGLLDAILTTTSVTLSQTNIHSFTKSKTMHPWEISRYGCPWKHPDSHVRTQYIIKKSGKI